MKVFLFGLLVIIKTLSASADEQVGNPQEKKADFRVNAGWALGMGPEFFGSASMEFKHRPMLDLRYKDRFQIFGPKVRYALYKDASFSAGPLLNYSFGRKESDNVGLEGLGDNPNIIEAGMFLHYKKKHFELRLEGKSGLGKNSGETLTATMVQGLLKREKISMLLVLRARFQTQKAMQRQFGVTESQAAMSVSSLSPFKPSAGVSNSNIIVLGEYKLKKNLSLMFIGSLWKLMADAKNSPIIKSDFGHDFQSLFGTALIYKF